MRYGQKLRLAWALTWRLLLAEIVLGALLLVFLFAFAAPARWNSPYWFALAYAALGWLLLWPFVLRRGLPPELFGFNPKEAQLQYWPAVMFGLLVDLASLVPVIAMILALRVAGFTIGGTVVAILLLTVRLFAVLPGATGLLGRRSLETRSA